MRSPYVLEEQETTISVFPKSVSDKAEVYTCIPNMVQRILKLHSEYPDEVTVVEGDGYVEATVPCSWIKIQPKRKCTLSEEQKKKNAQRLAALRAAKKGAKADDPA